MNRRFSPFAWGLAAAALVGLAACDRGGQLDTSPRSTPDPVAVERPGVVVDDSVITTKVKTALLAEPNVNGNDISVTTTGGQVTLSGVVPAPQIMRAEAIARGVEGVHEVVNRLAASEGSS